MLCGCSVCHSAILAATIWGFGAARQDIWHAFFLGTYTFLKAANISVPQTKGIDCTNAQQPYNNIHILDRQTIFGHIRTVPTLSWPKHFVVNWSTWTFELLKDWRESLNYIFWLAEAQFWVTCWIWICAEIGWLCSRNALRSDFNTFCARGLFYIPTFAVPRREREKGEIRTIWESGLVSAVSLAGSSNFSRLNRHQLASSFSSAGNCLVPRTSFVPEKKIQLSTFCHECRVEF